MTSASRVAIQALAEDFVGAFRQTRGKWQVAQALTQIEALIVTEYGARFLFELIQNGYDAHEPGDHGAISIVFDAADGRFGTLYVANRGRPFRLENFIALCNPALSSKQPGEGIGNKGVGFRSVIRVCERPEVYSASERSIAEGIQAGELDKSWGSWASDGYVGVALPLDSDDEPGHLYTYLPMGLQAVAPLPGHLNASMQPFGRDPMRGYQVTSMFREVDRRQAVVLSRQQSR